LNETSNQTSFEFNATIHGGPVPVASLLPESVRTQHTQWALASKIFTDWVNSLDHNFAVSQITVQAVDFRGKPSLETVMFVRFLVQANKPFPEVVELRGTTVVMLVVLRCKGMVFTVLVRQPRIASGDYGLVEIPAGMTDGGTFTGAAAKELKEELGLVFSEDELIDLVKEQQGVEGEIYLSPGLLDERARFYLVERDITQRQLLEMQGKATGVLEEAEQITLWVVPLRKLPTVTRDGKAFIALCLYKLYNGE